MANDGRGALVYPSRPGRSGLSLHRTGRMAMLHALRGQLSHALRFLYFWSRVRPEKRLPSSPAFFLLSPGPNV